MGVNAKCPKCGGTRVQLSNERSKHGCFWFLVFGLYFIFWTMIKWMIGLLVFMVYDWWVAIIHACMGKGHIWQSKKLFSGKKRIYYCHDCGHNFRA